MINLIGDKCVFAVQFEVLELKPGFNSHVMIWVNNVPVGDFKEEGYLSDVLLALSRITRNSQELWLNELKGLTCKDIFYAIIPLYNNPDSFFDLSEEAKNNLIKYDKFLFEWGDSFKDWYLKVVVYDEKCKFLWVNTPLGEEDSFEVRNNIKCFDVDLKDIKNVYNQLKKFIPDELWPSLIPK